MNTENFPKLLEHILCKKGATLEDIKALAEAGIMTKEDFVIIGDTRTLIEITAMNVETAHIIMQWALGTQASTGIGVAESIAKQEAVVIESADIVKCTHCQAKQPKDYKVGDLCLSCGLQAEPVHNCYWCLSTGPGQFCRTCGAEFVASSDYEVALQLKMEGESKSSIGKLVKEMTAIEKENIWAKIRKGR
ncbi:hypothetical protein VSP10_13775 [Myroides odoratimimus]|uniref:DZANK-type domain-containing protein n=1 Tax=Myroides odoratimimus CIP 101113 TaxID=883154 RepID=A0AAV3F1L3_9FLAO|nr:MULTISPECIES: hypothetical protein [Myroides]APA93696.1 hypothetical protein BK054_15995 [Myroides sp. ZB35]EHO09762.1 hypothetical protein HMPREF9715_02315 [Myroides odoratimimus CIP 101113]MEC4053851.1 hypothetical protein [Myroides odoratimimus]